jgi:hypothetical protein
MSSVLAWGAGSPTQAPQKERLFLPRMNDGGFQVRRSVSLSNTQQEWFHQLSGARYPSRRDRGCVDVVWGRLRCPGLFSHSAPDSWWEPLRTIHRLLEAGEGTDHELHEHSKEDLFSWPATSPSSPFVESRSYSFNPSLRRTVLREPVPVIESGKRR